MGVGGPPTTTLLALLAACGDPSDAPTWDDVSPVIAEKCTGCHQPGAIGPMSLTTFDEAYLFRAAMRTEIASGAMPPWKPAHDCNSYEGDFDLTAPERELLLAWLDTGAHPGSQDPAPITPPQPPAFEADLALALPEAYTPTQEPDDYRCQLVPLDLAAPTYITGLRVIPGEAELVHHVIVFGVPAAQLERVQALDAAHDGPGWTCFGGPTNATDELRELLQELTPQQVGELLQTEAGEQLAQGGGQKWIGAWVPGVRSGMFAPGTGIRLDPGDMLVVQMHYNTSSADPRPDRSVVELALADTVARPAYVMPFTSIGWLTGVAWLGGEMTIPAGEPYVEHEFTTSVNGLLLSTAQARLGLPSDSPLVVHGVGHHMHQLGTTGELTVIRPDNAEECLLRIDDWDFGWQGGYGLSEPVTLSATERMRLRCTWDNSPENQPIVDGEVAKTQDVAWGEGTSDEMCLGTLYVTGP